MKGWVWIGRFSRSSIHRPRLSADCWGGDEHGAARAYIDLSWGDRHSDPVWGVGWEFPIPGWFMDWRVRRWEAKHAAVQAAVGESPSCTTSRAPRSLP